MAGAKDADSLTYRFHTQMIYRDEVHKETTGTEKNVEILTGNL